MGDNRPAVVIPEYQKQKQSESEKASIHPSHLSLDITKSQSFISHLEAIFPECIEKIIAPEAVKAFYSDNIDFLIKFFDPVFSIIHTQMYNPENESLIHSLTVVCGNMWGRFCFPIQSNQSMNRSEKDTFYHSFPYFITQSLQYLYIKLTNSHIQTVEKAFRFKLCALCIKLFTTIEPLETQVQKLLGSYFTKPPPADISEDTSHKLDDDIAIKRVRLPTEDLKTLTEMQRRKRPRSQQWNMSGISPLISAATNHRSVPYEHDAFIVVQYPAGGEADWTTDLPPLLPPLEKNQDQEKDYQNYDPMSEPRSLLHRSRRPDICNTITEKRTEYLKYVEEAKAKQAKYISDLATKKKKLHNSDTRLLKKFVESLRTLQIERKRNETPDIVEIVEKAPNHQTSTKTHQTTARNSSLETSRKQSQRDIMASYVFSNKSTD